MADKANVHPTDGRRRKEKGPPSNLALPRLERVSDTEREHSEDSAGEKEAKRQRSNPGTPVSTPRRMPYDYDAVMGITRVGTREAEGFDEDLDSTEYHDANDNTEEPIRKEETEANSQVPKSTGFQGGYGSSSLKECIELLNTTSRVTPARQRFSLRGKSGNFLLIFGAISLLSYTENLERKEESPLEKIFKKIQWRWRPEIADFCRLSWSNAS